MNSVEYFNLHQLDMGQFDPSTCQNSISQKLSCNFFWYFMTLFGYILSIIWQNMAMLPYLRKKLLKIYFSGQFDPNVVWQLVWFWPAIRQQLHIFDKSGGSNIVFEILHNFLIVIVLNLCFAQICCVCTGASVAQLPYRYRLKSCRSRLKYCDASVTS